MKTITVRQPWAWLIVRPDLTVPVEREKAYAAGRIKDIENRSWGTKVRGRVLIHAAKGMTRTEYDDVAYWLSSDDRQDLGITLPSFEDLNRGGVIGSVEIIDCLTQSDSRWFFGKYGFLLKASQPLPFRTIKGQLGFFDVPNEAVSP